MVPAVVVRTPVTFRSPPPARILPVLVMGAVMLPLPLMVIASEGREAFISSTRNY